MMHVSSEAEEIEFMEAPTTWSNDRVLLMTIGDRSSCSIILVTLEDFDLPASSVLISDSLLDLSVLL